MYAIYGNIYHQYTPNVSIYIPYMDPMGIDNISYVIDISRFPTVRSGVAFFVAVSIQWPGCETCKLRVVDCSICLKRYLVYWDGLKKTNPGLERSQGDGERERERESLSTALNFRFLPMYIDEHLTYLGIVSLVFFARLANPTTTWKCSSRYLKWTSNQSYSGYIPTFGALQSWLYHDTMVIYSNIKKEAQLHPLHQVQWWHAASDVTNGLLPCSCWEGRRSSISAVMFLWPGGLWPLWASNRMIFVTTVLGVTYDIFHQLVTGVVFYYIKPTSYSYGKVIMWGKSLQMAVYSWKQSSINAAIFHCHGWLPEGSWQVVWHCGFKIIRWDDHLQWLDIRLDGLESSIGVSNM